MVKSFKINCRRRHEHRKGDNMRKFVFCLVLVMLVTGVVFAQEGPGSRPANIRDNWLSGELSIFGGGARYERMLNGNMSIGANFYYSTLILFNELGLDASFRFYPTGKTFFLGIALGYHWHTTVKDGNLLDIISVEGIGITPELGWKIDVGAEGGFYLQPGIKLPLTIGEKTFSENVWRNDGYGEYPVWTEKTEPGVGFGFVPYFGMGFAF